MLKKAVQTAAVAASLLGAGAALATPAMAIGNDEGVNTVNGNGAAQIYGNGETKGKMSPQATLVQGTANKLCLGVPAKVNAQSLVGALNIGVQDIPVLSAPQTQQCTENSTQAKGDEPVSHVLSNIPILSGNLSAGS
ncbi:RdlA protein [Streptomyces bambusae]|uniref:rodlin n=1 Tax=Streptomyces bambusae TaxID=1550616 RepID=UPI001CFD5B4A|nr:rodlin [Streptomyces bambusae]MCB5167537.1 RdlA protein [Streptomyces bambusae]